MGFESKFPTMYDAIVIGAGPAGLASAHHLANSTPNIRVIIIEAGKSHRQRPCPVDAGQSCKGCGGICNVISGFGGCMHYGDGAKFSMIPAGRRLIHLLGENIAYDIAHRAFELLISYTGNRLGFRGCNIPAEIHKLFAESGLSIREYPVAVVSETELKQIIDGLYNDLIGKVTLRFETTVIDVKENSSGYIVTTNSKTGHGRFSGRNVIFATGRRGLLKTQNILKKLEVPMLPPKASIGVRFEMRCNYLTAAGLIHPDMKISQRYSSGEKIKTFCFCGGVNGGRIKFINYQDAFGNPIITLDGHNTCERKPMGRELAANFCLLSQIPESEKDMERWLQSVLMRYRKVYSGQPLVQRLRTFQKREPEPLSWAALSKSLPFEPSVADLVTGPLYNLFSERNHANIIKTFNQIMTLILQLAGNGKKVSDIFDEILVLGPEIEFLWNHVWVDSHGETPRKGLFVIGDAAGLAQGIIQAVMMGLQAGELIAKRLS